MNAIAVGTQFEVIDGSPVDWPGLTAEVNRWRGECLHHFTRAEAAVSEALLLLARDAGATVTLPHLVGTRYDELDRVLITYDGAQHKAALLALRCFRKHDKLRVFLCHGVATVFASRNGDWHVLLDLLAFRNGVAARDELLLPRGKAEMRFEALRGEGQRLCQKLAALAPA